LPKFQVYKDAAGKFRFRLRADNNEIVAVGEAYEKRQGCLNGIKSIQKNSGAPVEDTTIKGRPKLPNPKYEINKDAAGQYRFHLRAGNGQVIADSEGYEKKADCLNGINIIRVAPTAEIEDTTIPSQVATESSTPNIPVVATATTNTIPATVMVAEPIPEEGPDRKDEMLQELKKIRASVEAPPPSTPPKGFWNEFKDFISKYKILGMAIAIVIGLYLGLLIQALVAGLLIPLIGLAMPGINLSTHVVTVLGQEFTIGDFLIALITFIIVALIAFLVVKVARKWRIE
jgi:large conductance mechanosensitive channel protein